MNSVSAKTYKYWGWLNPSVPCVVPRGLTMMVMLAMSSLGFQLKSRTLTWNCVTDKTRYQVSHSHNWRRISTAQSTKLWRICTTHSMKLWRICTTHSTKLWRTRKLAGQDGGKHWMWQALDASINNNNNNEYLERLTRTGPKRLHILYKYIFVKIQCIQHEYYKCVWADRTQLTKEEEELAKLIPAPPWDPATRKLVKTLLGTGRQAKVTSDIKSLIQVNIKPQDRLVHRWSPKTNWSPK